MYRTLYQLILAILLLVPGSACADYLHFPGQADITGGVGAASVLNVKGYGAKGDGASDDTAAIQKAATAARNYACVYFPAGKYLVTQDLNFNLNTCVVGDDPSNTEILCEDTAGNCLDLSGSDGYSVRNINLQGGTSAANAPKVVILLTRTGPQGWGHTLDNVWTSNYGPYTIYDYGAEVGQWTNIKSNSPTAVISTCNTAHITSKFQTLTAPPTSMSAVQIRGGHFNATGGINNCAITLDDGCANSAIYDINIWGTFFGEMSGGGTGICDVAGGGGTSSLLNISIIGVRLEASDLTATNYRYLDFGRGPSYVYGLNMVSDMMGVEPPQNQSALNFGSVDGSRIALDFAPTADGIPVLTAYGHGDDIRGIAPNKMSPELVWGPTDSYGNAQGTAGNFISWYDTPSGNGHVDAGGAAANIDRTNLAGTSGGNLYWSMPMHAQSYKVVVLDFVNYQNATTTAQQITYPVTFLTSPTIYGTCPPGLVVADGRRSTLPTSMGAPFSGQCLVGGS